MFKLFRNKNFVANPLQDKMAGKFVAAVLRLQRRWASFMNSNVNGWTLRWKKVGLGVFVGLSVLVCVSIVIETFTGTHSEPSFKVKPIRQGKYFSASGEIPVKALVPDHAYERILAFHHFMDSISVANRRMFDSINHCRPGLLDSAIALEKLKIP